jgi:archaetidylinositol phosphate synthase
MALHLLKFPYRKILLPLAKRLHWLHPDVVSYAAVLVAGVTGLCFYKAADSPALLIWAIVLTLLRMSLNTLDGVLAIQRGRLTLRGKVVNALPDRYADIFVVAGVALSPLCRDWLGVAALCSMFLVSYTGILGKALGVSWQQHGPLDKVERLVILMVFSLIQFFVMQVSASVEWLDIRATPMEWAMGAFVVLGQITVIRRLKGLFREIARKEAPAECGENANERIFNIEDES